MKHKASKKPKAIVYRRDPVSISQQPVSDETVGNAHSAEEKEVAGRHGNVGQKDHKGAR